ncbi:MAG TPA: hypothetical protein V6C76_03090 [Drouetiella sp.]
MSLFLTILRLWLAIACAFSAVARIGSLCGVSSSMDMVYFAVGSVAAYLGFFLPEGVRISTRWISKKPMWFVGVVLSIFMIVLGACWRFVFQLS